MNTSSSLTGNLKTDLEILLPPGNYEARIQNIKGSIRLNDLQTKYKNGIQQNHQWFLNYMDEMNLINSKGGLPYHVNLGLTEVEYDELSELLKQLRFETSSKESILIVKEGKNYVLTGSGILGTYDKIVINSDSNYVTIGVLHCKDLESLNISEDDNAFGSSWKGYSWKNESKLDTNFNFTSDLTSLNVFQLKFTLGRLDSSGERYIGFTMKEVENGEKTIDIKTTVLL
jgi:hypothetical protein